MLRAGGVAYTIDLDQPIGSRISELRMLRTDRLLAADKEYVVAGWRA
jgi:sulfur-oxidizing protein SoxB